MGLLFAGVHSNQRRVSAEALVWVLGEDVRSSVYACRSPVDCRYRGQPMSQYWRTSDSRIFPRNEMPKSRELTMPLVKNGFFLVSDSPYGFADFKRWCGLNSKHYSTASENVFPA